MFFVGMYELTIDSKNRLSIPHAIRSKMNCDTDGRSFYIVPGQRRGTLAIFPERYFEQARAQIPTPEQLSEDGYEWRQFEYSQSALLDPDNQGRILIPERLLKRAGIGREVTLIGVQDRLELWSRAEFDAFLEANWPAYPQHRGKAMQELREWQAANVARQSPA
ncbi:MAG: division/cell wall cluster transcriptional repressor MraZ [Phycisphaerae bacterium]